MKLPPRCAQSEPILGCGDCPGQVGVEVRSIRIMSDVRQLLGWWYLSFVGEQGWLGACFVRAEGLEDAAKWAHRHGCNPGGQVSGYGPLQVEIKDEYANRILTLKEAEIAQAQGASSQMSTRHESALLPEQLGTEQSGVLDVVEPLDKCSRIEPDTSSLEWVYCSVPELYSAEGAWEYAVSGKTAAQEAGVGGRHLELVGQIIAKAAAYGWWPVEGPDDQIVAVPIAQWVADGHPYSRKVPNLAAMLDRWNIDPVVIDGEVEPGGAGHGRLRAIEESAGSLKDVFPAGYLEELRSDWPV